MKIGVLGAGQVGQTIGKKLISLGHEVKLGSRSASNEKGRAWADQAGPNASHGAFADSAAFGELLFNCTPGDASLEVLAAAGEANLGSKVLIDVANPLDFSKGAPPTLFVGNDDSLGERIQRAYPRLKVVKTLNTVNCEVMVDAARVAAGDHTMFLCGNDANAKAAVRELLTSGFGWRDVIDLGDISNARATEALLPIWIRLWGVLKTGDFNVKVVR
ncbi:MAG TPA: NAD(P)-binding domain-containing protein [Polyangiaceae bacterium]|nr:NAD(P)-binding domain-containing protein [Polyangiaceae bacterium]